MVKGVIFDADGTLLDSMQIWHELGERYLAKHGVQAEPGLADILYPMTLEESSHYLKEKYALDASAAEIACDTVSMLREYYLKEVTLKPGVIELLDYLKKHNVPMIVATSSEKDILEKTFQRLQIAGYFCGMLTSTEVGCSKRDPTIYLEAAKKLGSKPEETVVFEDVLHGILAAKSAGFVTVAVADFSNKGDEAILRTNANYYINDFTEAALKII